MSILLKVLNHKPLTYSRSLLFNLLGGHALRTCFYNLKRVIRLPQKKNPRYRKIIEQLKQEGVVKIENFYSPTDYQFILQNYQSLEHDFVFTKNQNPEVHVMKIYDQRVPSKMRELLLDNKLMNEVLRCYMNRKMNLPTPANLVKLKCEGENLLKAKNGGTNNLHIDLPARVFKAIYYVTDTDENNGAFVYAKGSHRRNLKTYLIGYFLSIRYCLNKNNQQHDGEYQDGTPWVKIKDKEKSFLGIKEESITGKGNTLILFDASGWHRRGNFTSGESRRTVEYNFRSIESLRNFFYPFERWFK